MEEIYLLGEFVKIATLDDYEEIPSWLWEEESEYCPIIVKTTIEGKQKFFIWDLPDRKMKIVDEEKNKTFILNPLDLGEMFSLKEWRENEGLEEPDIYLQREQIDELNLLYQECCVAYNSDETMVKFLENVSPANIMDFDDLEILTEIEAGASEGILKSYLSYYLTCLTYKK